MDQYSASFSFTSKETPAAYEPQRIDSPFTKGEPSEVENWHDVRDVAAERIAEFHDVEETALGGMEMLLHAEMTEMERRKIREALTMYVRQEFQDPEMHAQAQILLNEMMDKADNAEEAQNGN